MSFDIRFEQPGRPEFAIATAKARQRSDHTTALIAMGLSLACSALSIFDLFLLASGH